MVQHPTGTVTFLFTDLEGSSKLWETYPEAMKPAIARLEVLSRQAIEGHRGEIVKSMGDGFMASFAIALDALEAALELQRAVRKESWAEVPAFRIRAGIHAGTVEEREGDYFGATVNRTARLMNAANGGQTLLSETAHDLVRDTAAREIVLLDLGQHRLRDLVRPERIFQASAPGLETEFQPIRTLDVLPNNLPKWLTTFVGREREMEQVKHALDKSRLLTLTGAGGTGKTRLSIEAGAELVHKFRDGVWLVEFAPVTDPALVPQTIAAVLRLREERGRTIWATLVDHLALKELLLILDNCEHLIEPIAKAADELLRNSPQLKVLASSREPLRISGEQIIIVPSLAVPDPQDKSTLAELAQCDAVQLFLDRAVNSKADFALTAQNAAAVAQIVRRLDGIPLAIELSAARINALSVEKIAARLDDAFNLLTMGSRTAMPRQQTLSALIDWSHGLLTDSERILFRRLSVMAGGWTLAAAEDICAGEPLKSGLILNLLAELVEKSLVSVREDAGAEKRYAFLEIIRQYARNKLVEAGEERILRARHCAWFMGLSEEAEACFHGPTQAECLNRLERDYDNLNAAIDWAMESQDAERAIRFTGMLFDFWNVRGYWSEGRDRLNRALALPGSEERSPARAKSTNAAATLALKQNDYVVAHSLFEASLETARAVGAKEEAAKALFGLGSKYETQNDYAGARAYYMQALEAYGELGSKLGKARTLGNLGVLDLNHGEFEQAQTNLEACLPLFRELGDQRSVGQVAGNLAVIAYFRGEYVRARGFCEESLKIARELKDKYRTANQLNTLGYIASRQGEHTKARGYFSESLTLFAALKSRRMLADVFTGLASTAVALGDEMLAAQLLGATQALVKSLGVTLNEANQKEFDRSAAAARARDERAFQAAWEGGMAMTLEEAIVLALGGGG